MYHINAINNNFSSVLSEDIALPERGNRSMIKFINHFVKKKSREILSQDLGIGLRFNPGWPLSSLTKKIKRFIDSRIFHADKSSEGSILQFYMPLREIGRLYFLHQHINKIEIVTFQYWDNFLEYCQNNIPSEQYQKMLSFELTIKAPAIKEPLIFQTLSQSFPKDFICYNEDGQDKNCWSINVTFALKDLKKIEFLKIYLIKIRFLDYVKDDTIQPLTTL